MIKIEEFLYVFLLSMLFGVTQKIADAANEHNVDVSPFYKIVWGILFGITGSLLSINNYCFSIYFCSLVIYWLIKNKLDYINHQIAGSIMFFSLIFFSRIENYYIETLMIISIFFALDFLTKKIKKSNKKNQIFNLFDKFKIRFIFISLIMSFWSKNILLVISVSTTITAILITTNILKRKFKYL